MVSLSQFREKFMRYKEANLFLVIAMVVGITMAYINPPFQECDGITHYLWATDVSYGNILNPIVNFSEYGNGRTVAPDNWEETDYHVVEPRTGEGKEYIEQLKKLYLSKDTTGVGLQAAPVSLFYYPQALGLFLARIFGMSVYGGVVLSRIFNLFAFLSITYLAIRITPILKNTMAVIALFPITIYQAASDSPDAMLNSMCFLFAALCFYYAYGEKEHLGWKDALILGALLGVVFLSKYVYACLGLLVFLIPMRKFGTKKEYGKCFLIAMVPFLILAGIGMMNMFSSVSAGQAVGTEGVTEGMTQMQYLMAHPKFIIQVLIGTFMTKFDSFMIWLNTLGTLNCSLGPMIYIVPMFAVFTGCLDSFGSHDQIKRKDRLLGLAAFLLTCSGVIMGIYMDGRINDVGALVVEGVQGRYFIPALPVLFLAVSPKNVKNGNKHFSETVIIIMGVMLLGAIHILRECYL